MKLVFLAGPFRGDGSKEAQTDRIERALTWVRKMIEMEIPFYSPHLLSNETRKFGAQKQTFTIGVQNTILDRCDVLAVIPGWQDSSGTKDEIKSAKERGIPVVYLEEEGSIQELQRLTK